MSEGREPTFIATIGVPGGGKTFQNIQQIRRVIQGKPGGAPPKKVLVFDSNDEYRNDSADVIRGGVYIKPIWLHQVAAFSASKFVEACRIRPFKRDGSPMSLHDLTEGLIKVMGDFRDGLLIAEDFKSFSGDSIKQDLVSKLCTRRHSGSDTLVSLQDIGLVAPRVWMNLKWLRMHKLADRIIKYKDNYPGKIKYLSIAENMVDNRYFSGKKDDERFFVMVDLMKGYIYGKYTPEEFNVAARQYISQNWKSTVGAITAERDQQWNQIHKDEKVAASMALNQLVLSYSQYSPRLAKK